MSVIKGSNTHLAGGGIGHGIRSFRQQMFGFLEEIPKSLMNEC